MTNPNLLPLSLLSLLFTISICTSVDGSRRLTHEVAHEDGSFGYKEGSKGEPAKWGDLNADWNICETGKQQSPINIDVKQAQMQPNDLKLAYKDAPAKLVNGGHDMDIEWEGDVGGIELNGKKYNLLHSHWHMPSEHTIDGKKFDVEQHMVHSNDNKELAVLSCLYTIGQPDPLLESLADKIKALSEVKEVDAGIISANSIRCGSKKNFRYVGSLTTPPCTEGVIWTIGEKARSISQDQIQLLKGVVGPEFQVNARPIQPSEGRPIFQFDLPDEQRVE